MDLLGTLDWIGSFGLLCLGFGFIILVHELGHFLVAKAVGIKVLQFAIGFGPAAVSYRKGMGFRFGSTEPELQHRLRHYTQSGAAPKTSDGAASNARTGDGLKDQFLRMADAGAVIKEKTGETPALWPAQTAQAMTALGLGETEYRFNDFPLGGYVKMLGQEDLDPNALSDDPRAYNRKSVGARAAVISAGVAMNLVFAILFFIVAFMAGMVEAPARIGSVEPHSPAATAVASGHSGPDFTGLRPNDVVIKINGEPAKVFTDIAMAAALAKPGSTVKLTVQRAGVGELTFDIPLAVKPDTGLQYLGIGQAGDTLLATPKRGDIWPKTLTDAHVTPGMRAVEADGKPLKYMADAEQALENARGLPVNITFKDEKTGRTAVVPLHAQALGTTGPESTDTEVLGLVLALRVHSVLPGEPAAVAGVQTGDLVARINDLPWPGYSELAGIMKAASRHPVDLTLLRDGKLIGPLTITPDRSAHLGVILLPQSTHICQTLSDAPDALRDLKLPPGSVITSIDHAAVQDLSDVQRQLQEAAAKTPRPASIAIGFELALVGRPSVSVNVPLTDQLAQQIADAGWATITTDDLTITHGDEREPVFQLLRQRVSSSNPVAATVMGLKKTWTFVLQTYVTLLRIGQRGVPVSQLQGPLGIANLGTRTTHDLGWPYLMFFLGLISVNLVVINFLPIPVVDGGHMVFLIIEKLRGQPVPAKVQAAATYAGLFLILGIFLMTLYFDIARLF